MLTYPTTETTNNEGVLIKLGWVATTAVAYGLLRWRLMATTHGLRMRVGCEADLWAGDLRLPEHVRCAL